MNKKKNKQKKTRVKMFEKLKQREQFINDLKEKELETQCKTSLQLLKTKIQKNQENFLKYIKDLQDPQSQKYKKKFSVLPLHVSALQTQEKFESLQIDKLQRNNHENNALNDEKFFDEMIQKKIKEKSYKRLQVEKIQDNFQKQITSQTCNFNLEGEKDYDIKVYYKFDEAWKNIQVKINPNRTLLELKLKSLKQVKENLSFQKQLDIGFPIDYKIKQYDASLDIKLTDNLVQTFFDLKESLNAQMLEQKAIVLIKKSHEEKCMTNQEIDLAQMKQIIDPNDEKVVLKLECEELNIKNHIIAIEKDTELQQVLKNLAHLEKNFQIDDYKIYEKVLVQNYYSFEVKYKELSFQLKAQDLNSCNLAIMKIQYLDKPCGQHFDQKKISFFLSEKQSKNFFQNNNFQQEQDESIYPIVFDVKLLISNKFVLKKFQINQDSIHIYNKSLFSFLSQQINFQISEIKKIQQKINDTVIITYIQDDIKKNLVLKSKKSSQIKNCILKNKYYHKQFQKIKIFTSFQNCS